MSSVYSNKLGEATATWLRRLINIGAPESIRASVRAILESETIIIRQHSANTVGGGLFQPIAALPALYRQEIRLVECHDTNGMVTLAHGLANPGLGILVKFHGFRRFAMAKAEEIGVTGTIQRVRCKDMHVVLEGTPNEIAQYCSWFHACEEQGMFQYSVPVDVPLLVPYRYYRGFTILTDASRPPAPHRPNGVVRGTYSDNKAEKLTDYSFHGGRNGDSGGGSGGGRGSSKRYLTRGSGKLASAGLSALSGVGVKRTRGGTSY